MAVAASAAISTIGIVPQASAASSLDYAALGDSQASGVGAGDYLGASGNCLRSNSSYPAIFARHHKAKSFAFTACSGATTGDIPGQASRLNSGTDLVTVQIGGNDVGFSNVMVACMTGSDASCDNAVNGAVGRMSGLHSGLDRAYRAIRSKAPKAQVVVVGYPRLFDLRQNCPGEMSQHKRSRLNAAADQLAEVTRNRAGAAGFTFVDTRGKFANRGVCAGSAWIHGVRNPLVESYHPNREGHRNGFFPELQQATRWVVASQRTN